MIEVSVPGVSVLAAPAREEHFYYISVKSLITITDPQNPIAVENQEPDRLPMILPTDSQLQFMRSREAERAEMEGRPMTSEEIAEKSGFGEARRALRAINQKRIELA